MTNEEAIRIICGKAPLVIRDHTGNVCDKTEELKTTIIAALRFSAGHKTKRESKTQKGGQR